MVKSKSSQKSKVTTKKQPSQKSVAETKTEKRAKTPVDKTPDVPLVSLKEISSLLRMSPLQVKNMAQTSQIPAVKVDGEWRFNKDLVFQSIKQRSRGM